jgi:hypothetical protein
MVVANQGIRDTDQNVVLEMEKGIVYFFQLIAVRSQNNS